MTTALTGAVATALLGQPVSAACFAALACLVAAPGNIWHNLAPDGSVWVHLDDAEVHRMRCLLDEVFGAGNFVTSVAWRSGRLGQAA